MRAKVISTYLDLETGEYVSPPAEVDLDQNRFERLKSKGCVVGLAPEPEIHKESHVGKKRSKKKGR